MRKSKFQPCVILNFKKLLHVSQYTVCIDVAIFVVLRLKYGQNKDILRKKKASIVRFSKYYFLFRDTRTLPTNRKLFIIDQFPKGRYKPIWSSNNPDMQDDDILTVTSLEFSHEKLYVCTPLTHERS